jgi:transposase-like protein
MLECPYCQATSRQIKASHNRAGGRECDHHYTPEPKLNGYPEHVKQQAIRLYLEGTNFRRIGRLLSVNYQSAVNWINSYHQSLPIGEQAVSAPEAVELDEVSTFIGSKKASLHHHDSRPGLALHHRT